MATLTPSLPIILVVIPIPTSSHHLGQNFTIFVVAWRTIII